MALSSTSPLESGFTLITLSIILTVASLVFVATLPGIQTPLKSSATSVTKMNSVLNTMRGYMAANGYLPCPADPTQAIGTNNYGIAAANSGPTNNCIGSTPAAAYADTTNHIAIGMLPVKTLGLSYADALDGYGRDITYVVDTNATAACWSGSSLSGAITVNDNGISYNTVAALISHGTDGYGAWLPLSGSNGTASRFDNGSTDTAQADNAQVAHGGGLTANTTFASFVRQAATSTFDDNIVYKSNLYTLNNLPASAQVYPTITPPANATYSTGQVLTFTLAYASNVTVMGTPRLTLSALGTGSIGTSNEAYATYQSGSGTSMLTFSYTVQASDSAPVSGIAAASQIDLNGGNISGGSLCFTAPDLSQVLIGASCPFYRTVTIDHTKVGTVNNTNQTNFPMLFSGTYSYLATVANGGNVVNANGYDINFTSDAAGTTLLPYEQESYNATTGAVSYWIKVPTVSHTADTVIYLQYCTTNQTNQSNKTGTWNSNYKGVWHLGETSGNPQDSTSYGSNATLSGTVTQGTTGIFGTAISMNGVNGNRVMVTNPADNHLDFGAGVSFSTSAWIYNASTPAANYPYIFKNGTSGTISGYHTYANSSSTALATVSDGTNFYVTPSAVINNNTWYLLVQTVDKSAAKMHYYVNGAEYTGSPVSTSPLNDTTSSQNLYMGSNPGPQTINGKIQEVRISSGVETADWISTEYNNQSASDKATYGASGFYTVGAQTSR